MVTTQTPQIPPMELLGLRREFKANFNNPKYVSSPCLNNLRDAGDVVDVYFEDESWGGPKTDAARAEFMAENPDVIVLAGPFGDAAADRTMAVSASQERTNVATFDWIGMYAALYNLEGQANHIIAGTKSRYECSARNAASVVADLPEEEKPTILWANYFSSGVKVGGEPAEGWSVAECPTDDHTYYCESAAHCGASIIARPEGVGFQDDYGYWWVQILLLGRPLIFLTCNPHQGISPTKNSSSSERMPKLSSSRRPTSATSITQRRRSSISSRASRTRTFTIPRDRASMPGKRRVSRSTTS